MSDADYPPVGLFYAVRVGILSTETDSRFKEASGLSVELSVEEVGEGGENRFRHRLPGAARYPNLVLRRGMVVKTMPLYLWCKATLQANFALPIIPQTVQVVLLNEKAQPLRTWSLMNAWPVKWSVSDFHSMEAEVVIETLELSYQYFEVS
ncbi:phage tail protein [Stigmatella aurantiaca]|uniref:Afp5 n=1 Tax=Stigmatella aurantiaca (strain DW4/3-1) TaxID=378806 RepID=Q09DG1_STIAD|nr:phage tail protein [Stigmatella aurantiaca]ADO69350.1 Conserved phage tail region protein [Stigmatella aurantiaca DW4/3-1]EAU69735.1 Afp5 [Stigmatella aurantiaca DW4/3-1]